jgi:Kef-type K+ transport system membrane component KefB
MHEVFSEIALLLAVAAAAGGVALALRQPVLIAYIVVGLVAGPAALGLISARDQIDLLAQIGVAVLLFAVGLKLDVQHVRHIGPVALATGLGQLAFTIAIGFALVIALGKRPIDALYVAVALTFSSTIIIVKLLSDKRELDTLHGRIAVGFLIVQDLAVVVAMMAMSALRDGGDPTALAFGASLAGRVALAGVVLFVLMRWVLPRLSALMARSQELLLVFAIAWGTGGAALGEWAGFSKEAGAFLAGFSLASTGYRDAITGRLAGIRDFLLLFFFVDLGARLELGTLGAELGSAAILSAFVLLGNPLIVMAIMGAMGYRSRTAFLAGLTVAQISEFSIVFVAMGIALGHVGQDVLGLVTLVGIATIAGSTYMILYSHPLYERLAPWLRVFERRVPHREAAGTSPGREAAPDVVVFGLGRYGSGLLDGLRARGLRVLGVDFDPEVVRAAAAAGHAVRFGDAADPDFVGTLPVRHARWAVATLPGVASHRGLLRALREARFDGDVALVARDPEDESAAAEVPRAVVLRPMLDAVDHAAAALHALIRSPHEPASTADPSGRDGSPHGAASRTRADTDPERPPR